MSCQQLSVIVVTSNQAKQTELCLQSLLEQDIEPRSFDVQVCDDGEVDLTDLVELYRGKLDIHYNVLSPRSSAWRLAANRNTGIRYCRGKRALMVDGDCILAPSVLKIHQQFGDGPYVVGGRRRHIPEGSIKEFSLEKASVYKQALQLCTREETRHWNTRLRLLITDHLKKNDFLISQVEPDWVSGFQVSYPVLPVRQIGGFWEKFTDYGGEEQELNRRLARLGLKFIVHVNAVSFHLDHPIHPSRKSEWWKRLIFESEQMETLVRNGGAIIAAKNP